MAISITTVEEGESIIVSFHTEDRRWFGNISGQLKQFIDTLGGPRSQGVAGQGDLPVDDTARTAARTRATASSLSPRSCWPAEPSALPDHYRFEELSQ